MPRPKPIPPFQLEITGNIRAGEFQKARLTALLVEKRNPADVQVKVKNLLPFEYNEERHHAKKNFPKIHDASHPEAFAVATVNGKADLWSLSQVLVWAKDQYQMDSQEALVPTEAMTTYQDVAEAEFQSHLAAQKRTVVYVDVSIDNQQMGRLLIQLFDDTVPVTVEHFLKFVKGTAPHPSEDGNLSYIGTKVDRIVPNGWLQAGEFYDNVSNNQITGEFIPDENFIISHSHRGMLSMVNYGPHSNYSQFMITMRPMPYFDRKFVCIGRCVDGEETLSAIERVPTRFERPVSSVEFSQVGVLPLLS